MAAVAEPAPGVMRVETAPAADPAPLLKPVVLLPVVGDVFAEAFLTAALKSNHGRLAQEVRARLELEQVELVAVDRERQLPDRVVEAHRLVS